MIPVFLDDINRRMSEWGTEGTINPFKEVYEVCNSLIGTRLLCDLNSRYLARLPNDCSDGQLR